MPGARNIEAELLESIPTFEGYADDVQIDIFGGLTDYLGINLLSATSDAIPYLESLATDTMTAVQWSAATTLATSIARYQRPVPRFYNFSKDQMYLWLCMNKNGSGTDAATLAMKVVMKFFTPGTISAVGDGTAPTVTVGDTGLTVCTGKTKVLGAMTAAANFNGFAWYGLNLSLLSGATSSATGIVRTTETQRLAGNDIMILEIGPDTQPGTSNLLNCVGAYLQIRRYASLRATGNATLGDNPARN